MVMEFVFCLLCCYTTFSLCEASHCNCCSCYITEHCKHCWWKREHTHTLTHDMTVYSGKRYFSCKVNVQPWWCIWNDMLNIILHFIP